MTFKNRFKLKNLLFGSALAVALSLVASVSATASASAMSDPMKNPVVASQCDHPGYAHFGFASRDDCLASLTSHGHGNGYGGNGYGGGVHINNHPSIFVSISNVVNSTINVTINFVNNIFS
jgi:hypothetical protein